MKDIDKFIDLYKSLGIELKVNTDSNGYKNIIIGSNTFFEQLNKMTINDKFGGYYGFYSQINFDKEGKFISQEFYE